MEFDDGTNGQVQAGQMLQSHGMTGTFFVNSGRINASGYMTLAQIRALAAAGNEIGGHTVSHANLPTLPTDEATRQVCDDRVTLLADGFAVSDFAYPYGAYTPAVEQIVAGCGYNSARPISGIHTLEGCSGCAFAERVPPADPYATRTPGSIRATQSLSEIEGLVTQAEQHGGGWVQLVMHHVCVGCAPTYAIDPATLSAFLDWLQPRAAGGTVVETVRQVIGGTVKPGVPGPAGPASPSGGNLLQNPSLENVTGGLPNCWQLGHSGINDGTGALIPDAHSGAAAEQVTIMNFSSGDERLLSREDLGGCAPLAQTSHSYVFSTWYHSTAPVRLVAYLRASNGAWDPWAQSPTFSPATASYANVSFTTPAVPSGAFGSHGLSCPCAGIAVAVSLRQAGSFTADDLSLTDTDTSPPHVTLTSPANGSTVSGKVTLSANASDPTLPSGVPDGIRKVDFLINGQIVGTATSAPYRATWNSTGHRRAAIMARATDDAGNIATSATVTVFPHSTQVGSALLKALGPLSIDKLLRRGGYSFSFTAPSPGHLLMSWHLRAKAARARHPLLVASASAVSRKAGRVKVRIILSGPGRRLLLQNARSHKPVKLSARATFTPTGAKARVTSPEVTVVTK